MFLSKARWLINSALLGRTGNSKGWYFSLYLMPCFRRWLTRLSVVSSGAGQAIVMQEQHLVKGTCRADLKPTFKREVLKPGHVLKEIR